MTGKPPFQELPSGEVKGLYESHQFPDVMGLLCGEIIERCWRCEVACAQEISEFIQAIIRDRAGYASTVAVLEPHLPLTLRVFFIFVYRALRTALGLAHSLLRVFTVHTFTFSLRAPCYRVGRYIARLGAVIESHN